MCKITLKYIELCIKIKEIKTQFRGT
jgi:hypothetical protein